MSSTGPLNQPVLPPVHPSDRRYTLGRRTSCACDICVRQTASRSYYRTPAREAHLGLVANYLKASWVASIIWGLDGYRELSSQLRLPQALTPRPATRLATLNRLLGGHTTQSFDMLLTLLAAGAERTSIS